MTTIRSATAVCIAALATVSLAMLGATATSADPSKAKLKVSPGSVPALVQYLPCQTNFDYPPNMVGGLYVTNSTGKTIPQGSKLTTVLFIGAKSYPQSKTMLGMWAAGKKHLARTFIWHTGINISCTATILMP